MTTEASTDTKLTTARIETLAVGIQQRKSQAGQPHDRNHRR